MRKYNLRESIFTRYVIYGEIYGDGIQKGYTYGCKPGERKLAIFDIMDSFTGQYLNVNEFIAEAHNMGIPTVPIIFTEQPFHPIVITTHRDGPSLLCPEQKVREGIVIKPIVEQVCRIGRKILKFVSDEYLLRDQSDFH